MAYTLLVVLIVLVAILMIFTVHLLLALLSSTSLLRTHVETNKVVSFS